MKASVIECISLPDIPSASGLEIYGERIFIIGDDSPYLYVLNKSYKIIDKVELFSADVSPDGRIPKAKKLDLESLTIITLNDDKYLLTLGSGSLPEIRDKGFLINAEDHFVSSIDLKGFYNYLRTEMDELDAGELNIEATVVKDEKLYLFQRGNITGVNLIFSVNCSDFIEYHYSGTLPLLSDIIKVQLPAIANINAGFSGACVIPSTSDVLFTASAEVTPNVIDDGPSLGSFVGIIPHSTFPQGNPLFGKAYYGDAPFPGKLESICVIDEKDDGTLCALAVIDYDKSTSLLIKLEIEKNFGKV